jgi:hypothetical protein
MHHPISAATHVDSTQRRRCRSDRGTGPRASRKVGVVGHCFGGAWITHPLVHRTPPIRLTTRWMLAATHGAPKR